MEAITVPYGSLSNAWWARVVSEWGTWEAITPKSTYNRGYLLEWIDGALRITPKTDAAELWLLMNYPERGD